MSRAALTREVIVEVSIRLIDTEGADRFTLRRLGDALAADPTAIYRHFRDKDELLRAVGDRAIAGLTDGLPDDSEGWRTIVTEACLRLRAAHVGWPHLATLVRSGPPMQSNEFALTEVLLWELRRAGLEPSDAALAYHSLIELTVGSAALDAETSALRADARSARYDRWRQAYAALDARTYPTSVALAPELYAGSAEDRFRQALEWLLDGIEARAVASARRGERAVPLVG